MVDGDDSKRSWVGLVVGEHTGKQGEGPINDQVGVGTGIMLLLTGRCAYLRASDRFHNPHGVWVASKFLNKECVVGGQHVSRRNELGHLARGILCHFAHVSLDVLHHENFPRKLKVVGEVVYQLHVVQSNTTIGIEDLQQCEREVGGYQTLWVYLERWLLTVKGDLLHVKNISPVDVPVGI